MALVLPQHGTIRALCEMDDTPEPGTRIFRFREWPKHEDGSIQSGMRADGTAPDGRVRFIRVFSYWKNEFDTGKIVGRYGVTATLEPPPGYVAAYAATTRPAPKRGCDGS